MVLKVQRYNSSTEHTGGLFFINGVFECFTLEDEYREVKVKGETRIPNGVYEVTLRNEGGMNAKYDSRYDFHKGMLWVRDIPNFKYVLIHIGNEPSDTEGCLLLGSTADKDKAFVGGSAIAYSEAYKKIVKAFENNEKVYIVYE